MPCASIWRNGAHQDEIVVKPQGAAAAAGMAIPCANGKQQDQADITPPGSDKGFATRNRRRRRAHRKATDHQKTAPPCRP